MRAIYLHTTISLITICFLAYGCGSTKLRKDENIIDSETLEEASKRHISIDSLIEEKNSDLIYAAASARRISLESKRPELLYIENILQTQPENSQAFVYKSDPFSNPNTSEVYNVVVEKEWDINPTSIKLIYADFSAQLVDTIIIRNRLSFRIRSREVNTDPDFEIEGKRFSVAISKQRIVKAINQNSLTNAVYIEREKFLNAIDRKELAGLRYYVIEDFPKLYVSTNEQVNNSYILYSLAERFFKTAVVFFTEIEEKRASRYIVDLKLNIYPAKRAIVKLWPLGGDTLNGISNNTISHIYRGKYHYLVLRKGYKPINGLIDLINSPGNLFDCNLIKNSSEEYTEPCILKITSTSKY